jgi:hypothetical protein
MMVQSREPITYVIDYGSEHLKDMDSYIAEISKAPPHLLHVAHDVPFPNTWGAVDGRGRRTILMSPGAVRRRSRTIEEFTTKLHEAGVDKVIPYICNQTIAGDPAKRRGIWKFYDHWDDYAEFGFGPRPPDPVEWLAREEYGRPHFNYEMRHSAFVPMGMQRYAPCPNNPHYRKYQRGVVENIARVGYDGVFVDNCVINCYCMHCQTKFKEHIQDSFTARDQERLFGFEDPTEIELGTRGSRLHWVKTQPTFREYLAATAPEDLMKRWLGVIDPGKALIEEAGNGWLWNMAGRYLVWMETMYSPEKRRELFGNDDLGQWGIRDHRDRALWAETKLFWAKSVAENLKYIRDVGESVRGSFLILPNWGEMQLRDGNEFREEIGHDLKSWQPQSDLQMFEESNEPGRVSPGIYLDFQLELKFALANDVRGCILSHSGNDPATTELSYAECLGGLGTYIQPGPRYPEVRRKYRKFQDEHMELLEGWTPYYQVGLAYFYNQLHLENMRHIDEIYKFTRYLLDQHVLFHYLTEEDLSPDARPSCRAIILPQLAYLSDSQLEGIENFMAAGGICFATGSLGAHHENAQPREEDVLERLSSQFPERLVHAKDISGFIPDGAISLDQARQFSRTTWKTLNVPGSQSFEAMLHLDDELGIQRYLDGGKWMETATDRLGPISLSLPRKAAGIRYSAFTKDGALGLHIVNYNIDLQAPRGERALEGYPHQHSLPRSREVRQGRCHGAGLSGLPTGGRDG